MPWRHLGEHTERRNWMGLPCLNDRCSTIPLVFARVSSSQVTCPDEVIYWMSGIVHPGCPTKCSKIYSFWINRIAQAPGPRGLSQDGWIIIIIAFSVQSATVCPRRKAIAPHTKVHLLQEHRNVIPSAGNITEEKFCVDMFEFATGVWKLC
jgi:hypothetical protein